MDGVDGKGQGLGRDMLGLMGMKQKHLDALYGVGFGLVPDNLVGQLQERLRRENDKATRQRTR